MQTTSCHNTRCLEADFPPPHSQLCTFLKSDISRHLRAAVLSFAPQLNIPLPAVCRQHTVKDFLGMPPLCLMISASHANSAVTVDKGAWERMFSCERKLMRIVLAWWTPTGVVRPPPGSSDPHFFQHTQKCPQLAAAQSARHRILYGACCQVMQSAGVPASPERIPSPPLVPRADILTVLQDHLLLSDASVAHCCADTYVERAAATAGSAAKVRAQEKVRKYTLHGPGGYVLYPPRSGISWPPLGDHPRAAQQAGAPRRGQWPLH